jgi:hypothetical protein
MAYVYNPNYAGGVRRRIVVQGQSKSFVQDPIWEIKQKRNGGVVQVIEHLPSKCEALSSNSSIGKKKKKLQSLSI